MNRDWSPAAVCARQSACDKIAEIWGFLGSRKGTGWVILMWRWNLHGECQPGWLCTGKETMCWEQQEQSWVQVATIVYREVQVLVICLSNSFSSAVWGPCPCPVLDEQCSYCAVPFRRCSHGRGIYSPKILGVVFAVVSRCVKACQKWEIGLCCGITLSAIAGCLGAVLWLLGEL